VDHQKSNATTMNTTTAITDTWANFWTARTAREKTMLAWGGAAVGVVIAYSLLWAPAQQGRTDLRATLPEMQRQIAQMTAEADEARTLTPAAQGLAPRGTALRNALSASLAQSGFSAPLVDLAGDAVRIEVKNASFPAWTTWLDAARGQFKVQVSDLHASALNDDGQVDLSATLEPASE
jgi:general secretion pathway protein M